MAMSVPEFSSATPTARLGSTTVAQAHALIIFLSLDTGTGSLPDWPVAGWPVPWLLGALLLVLLLGACLADGLRRLGSREPDGQVGGQRAQVRVGP